MTTVAEMAVINSLDARLSPESGTLTFIMTGRWDSDTTGKWWQQGQQVLAQSKARRVMIDASGVSYCDGAGIAFLVDLQQLQTRTGGEVAHILLGAGHAIHGLMRSREKLENLAALQDPLKITLTSLDLLLQTELGSSPIPIGA